MEVSYHVQTTPHWNFSNGLSQRPVVSRGSHPPPIAIGTRIVLPSGATLLKSVKGHGCEKKLVAGSSKSDGP